MQSFLLDTNVLLRLILNDNKDQADRAEKLLSDAEQKKVKIIVLPQVILEMEYVLAKVYKMPKAEIVRNLNVIMIYSGLQIQEKNIIIDSINKFQRYAVDLTDAYFASYAGFYKLKVFSFDRDFGKLK